MRCVGKRGGELREIHGGGMKDEGGSFEGVGIQAMV